ncbi:ankyrin repeat domain-containing protein [Parashewanella curva]|uniref:Ankyrin repeat domain-containing protein n=1 Tax=Parashewanella curva TaxID=2338552 RepID=A0A3L8PV40_9GAMM|nr:ankyrin repeat domain-containing protein [Parashewanella curva]RLV58288.1 ankyrin repeat domain-containing protein [Parashewanella curva]
MAAPESTTRSLPIGGWELLTNDGDEYNWKTSNQSTHLDNDDVILRTTKLNESLDQLSEHWEQSESKEVDLSAHTQLKRSFLRLEDSGVEHHYELLLKGIYASQLAELLNNDSIPQETKTECLISISRQIKATNNKVPDLRCHIAYLRCAKHDLTSEFLFSETHTIAAINQIFMAQFPSFDRANLPSCMDHFGFPISALIDKPKTPSILTGNQQFVYQQLVTIFYTPFYLSRQFRHHQNAVLSALLEDTLHNSDVPPLSPSDQLAIALCHTDLQDTLTSALQTLESDQALVTLDSLFFGIQTPQNQINEQLCASLSAKFIPQDVPLPILLPLLDSVTEQIKDYETVRQWASYLHDYLISSQHKWLCQYCATKLCQILQDCYADDSAVPFKEVDESQELTTLIATLESKILREKELTCERNIQQTSTLSEFLEAIKANHKLDLPINNPYYSQAIIDHLSTLSPQCDFETLIKVTGLLDEQPPSPSLHEAFIDYVNKVQPHQKAKIHSATKLINYQQNIAQLTALAYFSDAKHGQQKPTFEKDAINQLSVDEVNELSSEWLRQHYNDAEGLQILLVVSIKLSSQRLQDEVLTLSESASIVSWADVVTNIEDDHWFAITSEYIKAISKIMDENGSFLFHATISDLRGNLLTSWLKLYLLDFKQRDSTGNTPLHHACLYGDEAILSLLLQPSLHRLPMNQINRDGDTALHIATENNNVSCVRVLLNHKDTHQGAKNSFTGKTPLHYAIKEQSQALINLLINYNPKLLEIQDNEGYSPIALVLKSYPKLFEVLMEHDKFNPDVAVTRQLSTIAFALELKRDDLCCRLLQHYPKLPLQGQHLLHLGVNCPKAFSYLLRKLRSEKDQLNDDGCAPLHLASAAGDLEVITELLEANANRQMLTRDNKSALFFALNTAGSINALRELLEQGVLIQTLHFSPLSLLKHAHTFDNVEGLEYLLGTSLLSSRFAQAALTDDSDLNLFHCAIGKDAPNCIKYLASSQQFNHLNIAISKGEHAGLTPLMLAAKLNKAYAVNTLCEVYPEAYFTTNKQGYSAALIAVIYSSTEALQTLIDADEQCLRDRCLVKGRFFRLNPLQLAAHLDLDDVVTTILACAPNSITFFHDKGFSLAHIATESRAHKVLKILPSEWLDYAIVNKPYEGYTCLHLAVELSCKNSHHLETLELLTQLGATIDKATTRINYTNMSGWRWQTASTLLAPITLCAVLDNLLAAKILIQAGSKPLFLLSKSDWEHFIFDYARKYVDERYPLDKANKKFLLRTIVGD